jgi:NAD(P)-dependent dehydrogenase (short-subunit alcohol dehydrogenase family)
MGRLDGKIAIITGAAGGQGKVEAKLFAEEGAKVVATDLNEELLQQTVKEINEELKSEKVLGIKHDAGNEEDWEAVVAKTVEEFGKIDILINNAGMPGKTRENVWDIDADEARNILNVNTIGYLLGIKLVVPEMKKNGSGSIVNISSAAGLVGGASGGSVAYTASKGAITPLTKEIALDVGKDGIRVNTVYPGLIKTPIMDSFDDEVKNKIMENIPVGFVADPLDIAYGVLYLASDESRFVSGTELIIDGGYTAK